MDIRQWLEARIAALPEDAFDTLDDWPENAEEFDPALPGNFATALEPVTVDMEYRDAQGEVSERRVTLLMMSGSAETPVYLDGRCHLRNARRKFRFDRILSLRGLPGLGPDASPQDVLMALADLSLGAHAQRPPPYETGRKARPPRPEAPTPKAPSRARAPDAPAFNATRNRYRPELRLLAFLAKADGEMHPGEIAAIDAFAQGLASEIDAPDWTQADTAALTAYLQRLKFSAETERLCLDQLRHWHPDMSRRFARVAALLMEADGRIDPAERAMLEAWGMAPEPAAPAAPPMEKAQARPGVSPAAIGAALILILGLLAAAIIALP